MDELNTAATTFVALIDLLHGTGQFKIPEEVARLSPGSIRLLHFVARNPGTGIQEIASKTGLAKPTASLIVKRFIEEKIFVKESLQTDGRRISLSLTPKGERVMGSVREFRIAQAQKVVGLLDARELKALESLMNTLLDRWRSS